MNFCIDALEGHFVQHLAEKTITAFVLSKTLFSLTTTDFETTCGLTAVVSKYGVRMGVNESDEVRIEPSLSRIIFSTAIFRMITNMLSRNVLFMFVRKLISHY